jgi:hypothetical protein
MMLLLHSLSSSLALPRARLGLWLSLLALVGAVSPVAAQPTAAAAPPAPAVLLATAGGHASARALDSVISAALDDLKVVNVVARPGLDLGAVQLALDCVAETPQCLRIVTSQHEAEVLVAPTLARISNELVLTLLRFDARNGKTQRVLKRQQGQTLSSDTLDAVPGLLRELFGMPAKPIAPPPVVAPPIAAKPEQPVGPSAHELTEPLPEPPMEAPSSGRPVPVGPILLGAGGVVLLGAGAIMGLTVLSAEDDYEALTTDTLAIAPSKAEDQIDRANSRKDTGQTNAVITNVFLGIGSAAVIASGIWLALELSDRSPRYDDQVQLSPLIGRHELGLVLTHRGAGL